MMGLPPKGAALLLTGLLAAVPLLPAAVSAASPSPGDLVCVDRASAPKESQGALPEQCPVLLVAVEGQAGTARLLGPSPWDYRAPLASLRKVGKAALPGSLVGATETTFTWMGTSPNPGVAQPKESFGLLLETAGRVDTLKSDDWPNLHAVPIQCGALAACLDSLEAKPFHGLLRGPWLPLIRFEVPAGELATFAEERRGKDPQAAGTGSLGALALPARPSGKGGRWIWALAGLPADKDSSRQAWVWRTGNGKPKMLRVAPGDPFEVDAVESRDLDRDGHPEVIARTTSYYGDGTYTDLHLFNGHPDSSRPGYAVLSLSGSSGEAGGSDVSGDWWSIPPHVYHLVAAIGNDNAPAGATHDLRVKPFVYTRGGELAPVKAGTVSAALFGVPGSLAAADSLARRIRSGVGKTKFEIRSLPRVLDGKLLWQAGALAPDLDTAKRWARVHRTGKVMRVPAR